MITEILTTNDPEDCQTLFTGRLLEQSFGGVRDTVKECRAQNRSAPDTSAHELSFEDLTVQETEARAIIAISGGSDDGSTVTLELVRDGDQWKLDYLADIQIDRDRYDESTRRDAAAEGFTSREAECIINREHRLYTTDQLERAIVKGDYRDSASTGVLCLSRTTLLREFTKGMRESAPSDLPEPILDCVVQRITKGLSITQLRAVIAADEAARLESIGATVGKGCAKDYQSGLLGERPRT